MKLENYKIAMDSLETNNVKYENLLTAIENDEYRLRRNAVTAAAAAVSMAAVLGVTAAAESGLFTSMQKAFHTDDANIPIATEQSEYAFIPEAEAISGDGVTANIREAAVDEHNAAVFMDMVFENGIPQEIIDEAVNDYQYVCFENIGMAKASNIASRCVSVEDNTVSVYIRLYGIQEKEWYKDGISFSVENLGRFIESDKPFWDFETISDISGNVIIPPEQIKHNESKTAYSDIEGIRVKSELSLFGINVVFDSEEEYETVKDKITYKEQLIPSQIQLFMKDGRVYGDGKDIEKVREILGSVSGGFMEDGAYCQKNIGFRIPVDIEQIQKISISGYEFIFE